jgi:cell division protein FtsB
MGPQNSTWPSITRLAAIVAIVVALALGINLGRQATVVYRLRREEARLQQVVDAERLKAATLQVRKAYYQSDAFVEEWARTVAKLTQPGEVRVVILDEGEQPAQSVGPALAAQRLQEEDETLPYWQRWWQLFFGPLVQEAHIALD